MLYRVLFHDKGFQIDAGSIEEAHRRAKEMIAKHPELVIRGIFPPFTRPMWKRLLWGR